MIDQNHQVMIFKWKPLEKLRDWRITIKDWMRNNENIDDLPFYVLVLACEIPNFTKSLFAALKIDQRAVKTCVWHVLRVSNGKKPWEPTFEWE